MKRASEKLHSRRGASILVALLLMLLAAMVSAVIVSAALTAAHRVNDDRAAQQDALTLNSAGKLLAQHLREVGSYSETTYDPDDYAEQYPPSVTNPTHLLKVLAAHPDHAYTVTLSVPDGATGMKPVTMALRLQTLTETTDEAEYDLKGTITAADSAQRLFLSATLKRTTVTDTVQADERRVSKDEEGNTLYDDEGNVAYEDIQVPVNRTVETWSLVNNEVHLAASEDKIWSRTS